MFARVEWVSPRDKIPGDSRYRSREYSDRETRNSPPFSPTPIACATLLLLLHSFTSFHYIFHRGAQSLYSCPVTATQWARVAFVASQPVGWWLSGRVSLTRIFSEFLSRAWRSCLMRWFSRSCIKTLTRNQSEWVSWWMQGRKMKGCRPPHFTWINVN